MKIAVILPAGGSALRFGGKNKLLEMLGGIPVFAHSVLRFRKFVPDDSIVLAVPQNSMAEFRNLLSRFVPDSAHIRIVEGGTDRVDSVLNALEVLASDPPDFAAVHDAARPLVSASLIEACFDACRKHGSAVAVRRITDTVKLCRGETLSSGGLDRDFLRSVETPQIFDFETLLQCTRKAAAEQLKFTDDAAVVEHFASIHAFAVEDSEPNLKITYPADLPIAEALLRLNSKESAR